MRTFFQLVSWFSLSSINALLEVKREGITLNRKELIICRKKTGPERLESQLYNVLLTTPFLGFGGATSHLPQKLWKVSFTFQLHNWFWIRASFIQRLRSNLVLLILIFESETSYVLISGHYHTKNDLKTRYLRIFWVGYSRYFRIWLKN